MIRVILVIALACGFFPVHAVADGWDTWTNHNSGITAAGGGPGAWQADYAAYCAANAPSDSCTSSPGSSSSCGTTAIVSCTNLTINYTDTGPTHPPSSGTYPGVVEYRCVSPYVFNGSLTAPACGMVCPNGSAPVNGACSTCIYPSGQDVGMVGDATNVPNGSCFAGCLTQTYVGLNIVGNNPGASGTVSGLISTGQSCSVNSNVPVSPIACTSIPNAGLHGGTVTACGETGGSAFAGDSADTVKNGQDLGPSGTTWPTLQNDGCVVLSSGAGACATSFTHQPDNGTVGNQATPDAQGQITAAAGCPTGSSCAYNYYSQSTMQNSTNYGNGGCGSGVSQQLNGTCGTSGQCPSGQSLSGGQCSSAGGQGGTCDPTKSVCGGDSESGGTDCTAPPICQGDAIQCAQLADTWTIVCAYSTPTDPTAPLGVDTAITGAVAAGTGTSIIPQVGTDVDLSTWYTDSSNQPSTACVDDITFQLRGNTMTIPVSSYCNMFHDIGLLVLISACFAGLLIVKGH